jgi:cathepsin L
MKVIIFVLAVLACAFPFTEKEYQTSFTSWMRQHGKSYSHDEFVHRYRTFKSNMDFVESFNKLGRHTVAMNKFGDLTATEFGKMFKGLKMDIKSNVTGDVITASKVALPGTFDWRTKGAVTAVKNQQQCGSCWSFSTTGSVEGCHFLGTQKLVSLSEKNLMDCSWSQGNLGCNGGLMTAAMDYIIKNSGVDTEAKYPYSPVSSHTCKYNAANKGSTLAKYSNVQEGSEDSLQNSVNSGPTSVAIDASHSSFQMYSSGVYYEPDCSSDQLDHGVLAVGWGTSGSDDYWIVKNSWGEDWGNAGYIWMSRNKNNNCGIATMATLPTTCGN